MPESDLAGFVAAHRRGTALADWPADEYDALLEVADLAQTVLDRIGRTCLVHSDLNPKNVLVDPASREVTGLLDWEYAHAGLPGTDLGNLLRFDRQPPFADAVVATYRERVPDAGDDLLDTARAADLFALVDLAARRGENPVTERAHHLLRAVRGPGPARRTGPTSSLVGLAAAPPRILTDAQGVCLSLRPSRFSLAIASMVLSTRGPSAATTHGSETGLLARPHDSILHQGNHSLMTITPTVSDAPQVAVNDIGSEEDFLAAIDATIKYFNDGDIVEGTIVKVDRDEVLLDIGYKTEGVIPSRELSIKHDVDPSEVVAVGDKVEALVLQKEDKEGRLILSKKRAQYERAWGTIEQVKEEDGVVTGTVIEVVKGGLILDIGLRGFLPASLVEMRRVRDLQPYVGQELEAKIIELDKNRNNVVLSRRAWLEQTQSEVRQGFLTQLQKGQIRKGVVSSIVNFGAFVDLGGVDGLVHVSELSWKHIDHPSEVVAVGDEVTVEVLDVDMDRERVSLSLKATQEDPWQHFARTHQIGQIVPGKVTKLVPFGSFVRVEEGIEGLVHISELAERHVEIPEQVVQVNDDVMVKIIDIDLERRRISLSLKQANETADRRRGRGVRPDALRHDRVVRRPGQLHLPRGLRPRDRRVARGLRRAARRLGGAVRQGAHPLGGARQAAGRGRPGRGRGRRGHVVLLRAARRARRRRQLQPAAERRLARLRRGAAGAAREAHRRRQTSQPDPEAHS